MLRHLNWTLATLPVASPSYTLLSMAMPCPTGSTPLAYFGIVFLATLAPVVVVWFLRDHVRSWVRGSPMPSTKRIQWYESWSLTFATLVMLPACGIIALALFVVVALIVT